MTLPALGQLALVDDRERLDLLLRRLLLEVDELRAFAVSGLVSLPSQTTISALRDAVTLCSSAIASAMPSTIAVPIFL